jgi:hypothetical protein
VAAPTATTGSSCWRACPQAARPDRRPPSSPGGAASRPRCRRG